MAQSLKNYFLIQNQISQYVKKNLHQLKLFLKSYNSFSIFLIFRFLGVLPMRHFNASLWSFPLASYLVGLLISISWASIGPSSSSESSLRDANFRFILISYFLSQIPLIPLALFEFQSLWHNWLARPHKLRNQDKSFIQLFFLKLHLVWIWLFKLIASCRSYFHLNASKLLAVAIARLFYNEIRSPSDKITSHKFWPY